MSKSAVDAGPRFLSNRPYNKLSKGTTFSQLLEKTGKEYTKKNLDFNLVELAEDHPASALMGREVMRLRRMYYFDHQPFIYYEYHLPKFVKRPCHGRIGRKITVPYFR